MHEECCVKLLTVCFRFQLSDSVAILAIAVVLFTVYGENLFDEFIKTALKIHGLASVEF